MNEPNRTVSDLVPELGAQVVRLMKSEGELLRAELNDKVERVETAVGSMAAGGICILAGLIVLLHAIVVALDNAGMGAGWAALIVGGVTLIVGLILLRYGSGQTGSLWPRRTIDEAQRTADMVREKTR